MGAMWSNQDMIEVWNGDASASWATRPDRYDAMLGQFGHRVLAAAALSPGERVLDVGCGGGALTISAAEQVGPAGAVLGVDVATRLLALTARRASEAGQSHVELLEADAQVHPFTPGGFDAVISRFGVMFFADPVRAFANLLTATAPGGRLVFVAWQEAPANEWAAVPIASMAPYVGPPKLPPPGAPGPFAFADPARVRSILTDAGWAGAELHDVRTTLHVGGAHTVEEAVAFYTDDPVGQTLLRGAEPAQRDAALAALREALAPHVADDGVALKAAVWLVTARRPAS